MSFSLAYYDLMSPIRGAGNVFRFVGRNTEPDGDGKYYAVAMLNPVPSEVQAIPFNALGPFDTVQDAFDVLDTVAVPEVPA